MANIPLTPGPPFQFRLAGPVILCLLAFTGVFARGLANGAYGALLAWALIDLAFRRRAGLPGLGQIPPHYWAGAGAFLAVYALAGALGGDPAASFRKVGLLVYLLCALPAVYLAVSVLPPLIPQVLPWFYGAGLMAAGLMTFFQAGCEFACVRAKASLGVLELAAVLGQLVPLMVGSLALSRPRPRKAAFFLASLALAAVALVLNCSRIALICVPVLGLVMLVAFRRELGARLALALILVAALGAAMAFRDGTLIERFLDMTELSGTNPANEERLMRWRQGLSVFREHPLLGAGPGAVPNVPAEILPGEFQGRPRAEYYHSHQVFITVLAEAGILGLAAFLALHLLPLLYIAPGFRSRRPWTRLWAWAALTVFLQLVLNGMVDNVFTLKPLMYLYWTATGTAVYLVGREPGAPAALMSRQPAISPATL
ncbi:MAG: O-antigen ligase family protein [Deltaproteobacteria bacterium]|jgi:O-antigen ligase|nr:O-antigen ligase family protein [Deltaproteobacteria bacterium]